MNTEANLVANENIAAKAPLPAWKKWIFGIALMLGVVGVMLYGIASLTNHDAPQATTTSEGKTPGFHIQSMPDAVAPASSVGVIDWSTLFMKLGFSFVAGFAIAYALSTFLRIGLLIMGTILLLLFGLQYAGLIDVNWQQIGGSYDAFMAWLQPQIGGFRDFISSNLPSSVLATAGLAAGFRL